MRAMAIGIFGGTFDPIHCGHLAIAEFLSRHCPLTEIQFIPCLLSPHRREPLASPEQRLEMIRLAIAGHPTWKANDIDFQRPGPSYMVDTLFLLRQQQPQTRWCLILGMDAFAHFDEWREWREILKLAHLIIVNRPGFSLPDAQWSQKMLATAQIHSPDSLRQFPAGKILIQNMPPSPISATDIRHQVNQSIPDNALPPAVLEYIRSQHLYQRCMGSSLES